MGTLTDISCRRARMAEGIQPANVRRKPVFQRIAACLLLFGATASAQSATNFDTQAITPQPAESAPGNATPAPQENSVSPQRTATATPSRFVDPAEMDAYLEAIMPALSIRNRVTDPFGQVQDPNAKPAVKQTVPNATRRVQSVQATPFSDIVKLIKVTTIMPGEKRFLVGTRSIKQGDRFPINFRGKTHRVEVASVSSQVISFYNLDSGETATLKVNLLPAGMTPGTRGITAPGMVPDRQDAPINLDR